MNEQKAIEALIIDRTADDVRRYAYLSALQWNEMTDAEKQEWNDGLKGAYNANDLNRVESAVSFLANKLDGLSVELKAYGFALGVAWDKVFAPNYDLDGKEILVKTNWVETDVPTKEDMQRYLGNVVALRSAINYATDRLPTSMDNLTWQGANAIESALKGLDAAISQFANQTKLNMKNAADAWCFSGEVNAGEV